MRATPGNSVSESSPPQTSDTSSNSRTASTAGTPAEELLPIVYEDLRRLARQQLARLTPGSTFQPTALVHEAYLRLLRNDVKWEGTRHFLFAAARAMHDLVVEHARKKASQKRGGGLQRLDLNALVIAAVSPCDEILALSEALAELESCDPRKHQVVMLRFFAGLTIEQAAAAAELSARTVEREWRFARAWLRRRLCEPPDLRTAS